MPGSTWFVTTAPMTFSMAALRGGVDIVQLRMKDAGDEEIVSAGQRFAAVCAERDALLILNDRPDLVAAVDADGVHVGQDDVPVARARALVGEDRLVGLSTHSPLQIDRARKRRLHRGRAGQRHPHEARPSRGRNRARALRG